ncbi:acetyl-CoA decarbonylase/synthase complex subunit gamma [Hominifimenecus microfluidus]|uniref:Acetyl-CoA decarbonylase/synthase complex subunit gamma n=1 Tax=Hominifimenecus microfluidus TaxID=2885348 RepID=A0AAE3EBH4_9FIRM|nr:acetyl-CoA decarbonylase/synthase complex subunit gamma [Hominifimenecus microfluidus]MCC2231619.1 acetyl-CoA decarbonylase/synthase complex subunit gamma [Hominifimenecus microfluidus]
MALKGLDIFKMSPKTNCKECGVPTCMAFCMKVAQGALPIEKCPHMGADVIAKLSEATAPPMKTIQVGDFKMGGETVLARHEKTFVSKNLYAVSVSDSMENADQVLADLQKVDYERIGERMFVEMVFVTYAGNKDAYIELAKKAAAVPGRAIILDVNCPTCAKEALEATKGAAVILNGATAENVEEMNALATEYKAVLGVKAENLDALYDLTAKIEGMGNKNLVLNASTESIKAAFADAVQIRRAAIKNTDRTFGYPVIVNAAALAAGDQALQAALASIFTLKYGSIIVMEGMSYAQALPLYGLRQNVFTDPQKPMKVEPGIYPLNGADENAVCAITVDFALTYFVVSGEMERSGVPVNLLISDAGGYSVLTAWAAGKLSATSIAKFVTENVADKVKSRTLILPGKVAVLKGEVQDKLPDWNVVVGPNEAVQLVQFLKDYK